MTDEHVVVGASPIERAAVLAALELRQRHAGAALEVADDPLERFRRTRRQALVGTPELARDRV